MFSFKGTLNTTYNFLSKTIGSQEVPFVINGTNELATDAWGRQKAVLDLSLFHGLWTYDVPRIKWKQMNATGNDIATMTEQPTITDCTSVNGMLNITSGTTTGDIKALTAKRHPRYQPNRGHLYSTALNIPYPTRLGFANFGLQNKDNGVFFTVIGDGTDYTLLAQIRRGGLIVETEDITASLPAGFDITKGHVYDIQMQWRGVGNFTLFIDLVAIHVFNFLGTLSFLSTSNPAMPATFACGSLGEDYQLNAGCVDVTSEGGTKAEREHFSETTGDTLVPTGTSSTPVLAIMIPETFNGKLFTRDSVLTRITTFCKDEAIHGLYIGRSVNAVNIANLAWTQDPDSLNNHIVGGVGTDLHTAFDLDIAGLKMIYAARQEKDFTKETETPRGGGNFFLTAGDIAIITIKSDGNSQGGATIEGDSEI